MAESKSEPTVFTGAIDLLYFPVTPDAANVRCHEPIEPVGAVARENNIAAVFVTPCRQFSCDRRWMCPETQLDDVLRYTAPHPETFVGLGSYNPLDIGPSLQQAEIGITQHGFRGIYVHPGSFGLAPNDRRMYPLYGRALGWGVPVILDLRRITQDSPTVLVAEIEQIARDFSGLTFVLAQPAWSNNEMLHLVEDFDNLNFCFDTTALQTPAGREFILSPVGKYRWTWGSNGHSWKESLAAIARIGVGNPGKMLRENAIRIFALDRMPKQGASPYIADKPAELPILAE